MLVDVIDVAAPPARLAARIAAWRRPAVSVLAAVAPAATTRLQVFAAGFDDYVGYPFVPAEMLRRFDCAFAAVAAFAVVAAPAAPPDRAQRLVDAATALLLGDLAADLDVATLARRVGSNHTTLTRAFSAKTGLSPYAWLRARRLGEAARLLAETDLGIQQISFAVGYDDPANFATAFRAVHGCSPRDYRRTLRK